MQRIMGAVVYEDLIIVHLAPIFSGFILFYRLPHCTQEAENSDACELIFTSKHKACGEDRGLPVARISKLPVQKCRTNSALPEKKHFPGNNFEVRSSSCKNITVLRTCITARGIEGQIKRDG